MSQEIKQIRIQSRVDTKVNWSNENPILLNKEIGYERENGSYKIGDGIHNWNDLPYANINLKELVGEKTKDGGEIFNNYERNIASGIYSHAEGRDTHAIGNQSHVEGTGSNTTINGQHGHAEGYYSSVDALGAHAEGYWTVASGKYAHAEGSETTAQGYASHTEGYNTNTDALGENAHAEGSYTNATGPTSHAEGENCLAAGKASHAEGKATYALSAYQHAQGKYNIGDSQNKYAHIVGNGTDGSNRSNAHTLDWNGNAWFAGKVNINTVYNPNGTVKSCDSLATESYVNDLFNSIVNGEEVYY